MTPQPLQGRGDHLTKTLGPLARRFTHHDKADEILSPGSDRPITIVTGFGPTSAPTAGTLSVMLGVIEAQQHLKEATNVVVSDLGAWNSGSVPWDRLVTVRDQMCYFLRRLGLESGDSVRLRSQLDSANLVRSGRIARFLSLSELLGSGQDHFLGPDADYSQCGTEVGVMMDTLYTAADILGPAEEGPARILLLSGLDESHLTDLCRLVLKRQRDAGELSLGWEADVAALYFRIIEGFGSHSKMSKSVPGSGIHLGMTEDEIARRVQESDEFSQGPLLSAIELSSGWTLADIDHARRAFQQRQEDPQGWGMVKDQFIETFIGFSILWRECTR